MPQTVDTDNDLISTGEAARLLGVSRQHVVNLCDRGDLPSSRVGSHRRVRRSDIEATVTRLTPDQVRSWLLGVATAAKLLEDPSTAIEAAKENLQTMRHAHGPQTRRWLDAWSVLLDQSIHEIVEVLVAQTPHAAELRQNTPFAGLLDEGTRTAVLRASRS